MSKGSTYIQGIYTGWHQGKAFDALRVWVRRAGCKQIPISQKIHPTLRELNADLKVRKLKKTEAEIDPNFKKLFQRLCSELQSEHGLASYKVQEKLFLKSKEFDFETALEEFYQHKADGTVVGRGYVLTLKTLWIPFFMNKGAAHPNDFKKFKKLAKVYLSGAKSKFGKPYSMYTLANYAKALNEFMRFLLEMEYLSEGAFFTLSMTPSLEQKKRAKSAAQKNETYTLDEVIQIKRKIDTRYEDGSIWKRRAYAMFFGICSGLRKGNLAGLTASCLVPDADTPHFYVRDNVVSGWSRNLKGYITIKNATKTSAGDEIALPLIQPSMEIVVEVSRYLKSNVKDDERLFDCVPDTINDWWLKISKECGFKYLSPHSWKRTYATIGGEHLSTWYKGEPKWLQMCCLHKSMRTTEIYIKHKTSELMKAFSSPNKKEA